MTNNPLSCLFAWEWEKREGIKVCKCNEYFRPIHANDCNCCGGVTNACSRVRVMPLWIPDIVLRTFPSRNSCFWRTWYEPHAEKAFRSIISSYEHFFPSRICLQLSYAERGIAMPMDIAIAVLHEKKPQPYVRLTKRHVLNESRSESCVRAIPTSCF